jgi:hypothetical protein
VCNGKPTEKYICIKNRKTKAHSMKVGADWTASKSGLTYKEAAYQEWNATLSLLNSAFGSTRKGTTSKGVHYCKYRQDTTRQNGTASKPGLTT